GVPARSWLKARPAHSRVQAGLKRGPLPEGERRKWHALGVGRAARCAQVARSAVAPENERMWRAERRPPRPATDADTTGLRFSARHPPQTPDARVAARRPHVCREGTTSSIPPLDGEG